MNDTLNDQQLVNLYELLVRGKARRPSHDRVFLRGWNAGLDFAIKQLRIVADDPDDPTYGDL